MQATNLLQFSQFEVTMAFLLKATLSILICGILVNGETIELDHNFLQLRHNGPWLVKFYAPWCGHCRKMESAFKETASRLRGSPIRVARIDATQFVEVAANFHVRGYPTVKYIDGDRQFTHFGDRSVEGLVRFAKRAHRPAVTQLASIGAFREALTDNAEEAMFLLVGASSNSLQEAFTVQAKEFHIRASFYAGETRILPKSVVSKHNLKNKEAAVLVFKDDMTFEYEIAKDDVRPLNESLRTWIDAERFRAFSRLSEASIWEFASTGKRVSIFVVNESNAEEYSRFKAIGQKLAIEHRKEFHSLYHFGWMDDLAAASSLAMVFTIPTPNLLVLHPPSDRFYMRPDFKTSAVNLTLEQVKQFLMDVVEEKVDGYGGKGFCAKMKRLGFDFVIGLLDFITASPLVALFVLGIPIAVVSLFVYLICCLEPSAEIEEEEEEAHLRHMVSAHRLTEAPGSPTLQGDDEKSQDLKKND